MNKEFAQDYYRMTGVKYHFGIQSVVLCAFSHQIRYMCWWRRGKKRGNLFYRIVLKRYAMKYGLEISLKAEIGKGLYLGHPYNITVGDGVKIGDNVNLHKGCTIWRENRGKREGVPQIGHQVSIGINATVVGNVKIGNDVMIAPNSFVNFDVPSHSVVVGNPGVIHPKGHATQKYVGFCV